MKQNYTLYAIRYTLCALGVLLLSGCVVRTYPVTKDRIDQDLTTGNRGYLRGSTPISEAKERKTTRTTQVVEIELRSPIKFEKMPEAKQRVQEAKIIEKQEVEESWGNRGYITRSEVPEIVEPTLTQPGFNKYIVQKGDTLQKISQKFYGTAKKWTKIYEANKDVLKAPDKIYPDQVINVPNIPVEQLKKPSENLK